MDTETIASSTEPEVADQVEETLPEGMPEAQSTGKEPEIDPVQAKIDESVKKRLSREQRKHDREMAKLQEELQQLRQSVQVQAPVQPADSDEPREDDPRFSTYGEYLRALTRYEAKKLIADKEAAYQAQLAQENERKTNAAWKEKEAKAMSQHEDYEDYADVEHLRRNNAINQAMASAIQMSDFGPLILYYLGKNVEEAQRIAQLPPAQAILRLGRLESMLTPAPTKPKSITKAPSPVSPVGTGALPLVTPDKLSDEDFIKRRNAEWRSKRAS